MIAGLFGAAPISLTGGLFADVLDDPLWRGRAISWFMTVASVGPFMGPVVSGLLVQYGWAWPFWYVGVEEREARGRADVIFRFGLIFAGVTAVPLLLFLPETFGPALLKAKAKKMRKEHPDCNVYAPLELQRMGAWQMVTRIVGRPLRMMLLEPIVSATCCYLSLIYGTAFIMFQSFSVIYPREYIIPLDRFFCLHCSAIYDFGPAHTGLAFLPCTSALV